MEINKKGLIIVTVTIFIGIILLGHGAGFWGISGEDEVSGESLLLEVSKKYNIPLETIYSTWNIPDHISPRTELKEVKDLVGFSMGKFKIWVTAKSEGKEVDANASESTHEEVFHESGEQIKGTTTLKNISEIYNIPLEKIYEHFSLPKSLASSTQVKTLKDTYNIEISAIKNWVSSQ